MFPSIPASCDTGSDSLLFCYLVVVVVVVIVVVAAVWFLFSSYYSFRRGREILQVSFESGGIVVVTITRHCNPHKVVGLIEFIAGSVRFYLFRWPLLAISGRLSWGNPQRTQSEPGKNLQKNLLRFNLPHNGCDDHKNPARILQESGTESETESTDWN